MNLPEKIVTLTTSLAEARIPHAFGGAIALAFCTHEPRATVDLDVNVFLPPERAAEAVAALPGGVEWDERSLAALARDGQVRLWWDATPVDLFFNTTAFHDEASLRCREEPFGSVQLPVLACRDLAVFKAFFDRSKDWVDLESMAAAGALDVSSVVGVLATYLGSDDHRVSRVLALGDRP